MLLKSLNKIKLVKSDTSTFRQRELSIKIETGALGDDKKKPYVQ